LSMATAMCKVQQGNARLLVFVGASLSATPALRLRRRLEAVVEKALRTCGVHAVRELIRESPNVSHGGKQCERTYAIRARISQLHIMQLPA